MEELSEEVWKGQIPLQISLHSLSLASNKSPPDYFCLIARGSYLPTIYSALASFFESYSVPSSDLWLSFQGSPLKWHYPAGVLFDFSCGLSPDLPWHLEIHFTRYPAKDLLPYRDEQSVQRLFMNSLKESCGLLINTSSPVMDMSKADEQVLWQSVKSGNLSEFKALQVNVGEAVERVRLLPVKFLSSQFPGFVQTPVKPLKPDGVECSAGELVRGVFPGFTGYILAQGISVPDSAPIHWLWRALRHPDNFLYLTLIGTADRHI